MKTGDVKAHDLRDISLFSTLKKPALEYLLKLVSVKTLDAKKKLYGIKDLRDRLIIIRKGSLTISKYVGDEEVILSYFESGDFLGEEIIFNPGGYHRYVIKTYSEQTEIIELKVYDLLKLFQNFPETSNMMQQQIIHALNQRLFHTDEKLATIYSLGKIVSQRDMDADTLQLILELIAENLMSKKSLLISFDDTSKHIIVEKSIGYKPTLTGQRYSLHSDTILSIVHHSKKPLLIKPETWEKQYSAMQYVRKHFLATPLVVGNDIVGALAVADKENDLPFKLNDEILLTSLAKMVAPAVRILQHQLYAKNQEHLRRSYVDTHF